MAIQMAMNEEVLAEFRAERTAPVVHPPQPLDGEEANERYKAALKLVQWIDGQCDVGRTHFRTRAGILLTTLDEVVRAILEDQLEVTSWAN